MKRHGSFLKLCARHSPEIDIVVRYVVIVLLGLFNLRLFYLIFRPLTVGAVHGVMTFFTEVVVLHDTALSINGVTFLFVDACIGGAAYYLLVILVLSTRNITLKRRLLVFFYSSLLLFFFNVLRILFLIFIVDAPVFSAVHLLFWYLFSTVFVVLDWLLMTRVFSITTIPVYSDVLYVLQAMFHTERNIRHR